MQSERAKSRTEAERAFDRYDGIVATELLRAPLSGVRGYETVVLRLEIAPGTLLPRHSHPGDELLVVTEPGQLTAPDGTATPQPRGTVTRFEAGRPHGGVRSTGPGTLTMTAAVVLPEDAPFLIDETADG